MQKTKKLVLVVFLTVLLLSISILQVLSASSKIDVVNPNATYISSYSASFSKSGLSCSMSGNITGTTNVTKVKIKLELQKQKNGVYTTVDSWEKTINARSGSYSEDDIINPISTYRLKATVTAYSGSNTESKVIYKY